MKFGTIIPFFFVSVNRSLRWQDNRLVTGVCEDRAFQMNVWRKCWSAGAPARVTGGCASVAIAFFNGLLGFPFDFEKCSD